jgi:ParB-like chromosome segregation protein Spo0J
MTTENMPQQTTSIPMQIEIWPIDRLRPYPRNPRKNAAIERMCKSLRQFGFKIPCLVRSDGEIVDGHLRLKAARKLGITEIPVILCDEWTPAQVKAFRLMVNRSVTWADWDETALAMELEEIQEMDFDLSLTGFDPGEIDGLLALEDDEKANAAPPLPESPVSGRAICGYWVRTGCSAATPPARKLSRDCSVIASRG